MVRIFIALPVPMDVATQFAALVPADLAGLKRVDPELLHITLAFVGWTEEERIGVMAAAVAAAARPVRSFRVTVSGAGRFPPAGRPRVVWVATASEAAAEIERLGGLVRAELKRQRVRFDPKPLRSHVTLARVRDDATVDETRAIAAAMAATRVPEGLAFAADAVHVMESVLSPRGPRYSSRARVPLLDADPPG